MTKTCVGIMCKCCEEIRCYDKVANPSNRNILKKKTPLLSIIENYHTDDRHGSIEGNTFRSLFELLDYIIAISFQGVYVCAFICHSLNLFFIFNARLELYLWNYSKRRRRRIKFSNCTKMTIGELLDDDCRGSCRIGICLCAGKLHQI